jgi:hypothetical protein
MKIALIPLLLLLVSPALAGGDYVRGLINSFSSSEGVYSFSFAQTDSRSELIKGCTTFHVSVQHERVPWFSWLPFIHSNHPTSEQTKESINSLQNAFENGREVYFGYIGYGLATEKDECMFKSKGLDVESIGETKVVFSYHDPT